MNDLERLLRELHSPPPDDLEARTLLAVGAADRVTRSDSPVGAVWIAWSPRGVTAVTPLFAAATLDDFLARHRRRSYPAERMPADLATTVEAGLESGDTSGVPIDLAGIAAFQQSVLTACASIPVGTVRPYGWIAEEIGNPGSVRAVGTALGRNPIPLVVPCHRVVRSDGSIGDYAFGSQLKHDLLVREGAILA